MTHLPLGHGKDHGFERFIQVLANAGGHQAISATLQKRLQKKQRCALIAIGETVVSRHGLDQRGTLALNSPVVAIVDASESRVDEMWIRRAGQTAELESSVVGLDGVPECKAVVPSDRPAVSGRGCTFP